MSGNASGTNLSTLSLLNDSLVPGTVTPQQQLRPSAVAFDPALDRLYVASSYLSSEVPGLGVPILSVVDPQTDAVVGTISTPRCLDASLMGLVYDPASGLLYDLCNGNFEDADHALAIDPATGAIEANVSLGGYSTGPNCSSTPPVAVALAVAPQLDDLFALVVSCRSVAEGVVPELTLSIVDDGTGSIIYSVSLGPAVGVLGLEDTEPLAFDAASGQLLVSGGAWSPASLGVDVVDPLSGDLVEWLALPVVLPFSGEAVPLLYSAGAGAVLTDGLALEGSAEVSQVLRVDPVSGSVVPLQTWPTPTSCTFGKPCGPVVVPTLLTAGPGTGANVTVVAHNLTGTQFALVLNASDGSVAANVTLPPGLEGLGVDDEVDHALFLLDSADAQLVTILGPVLEAGATVPLEVAPLAEALDPATGTLYVATSAGWCGSGSYGPCANETVDVIPLAAERAVRSWPVTGGLVGAMVFDPLDQDLYVFTECGTWIGTYRYCLLSDGASAVTVYSTSGQWLAESVLSTPYGGWVPDGMAVDTSTGFVLLIGYQGHGVATLDLIDPSTAGVIGTEPLWTGETSLVGSVSYDPRDNLVFTEVECVVTTNDTYTDQACVDAFNGSTFALVYLDRLPFNGGLTGDLAFDSQNDTLFAVVGTSDVLSIDPLNGTVLGQWAEGAAVGPLTYDPGNNLLYLVAGSNLSEVNATTGSVVQTFPLVEPSGPLEVDPESGLALLAGTYTGTVTFAPGVGPRTYEVGFLETGLPPGTRWAVAVDGVSESGFGELAFFLPNGSYTYAVPSVPGFTQSTPTTGGFTVNGTGVVEPTAVFGQVTYALSFLVTGAPDPAGWNVSIVQLAGSPYRGGPCGSCLNSSTGKSFLVTNGTYRYLLESVGPGYQVSGLPTSGDLAVNGSSLRLDLGFVSGPTPSLTFRVAGRGPVGRWCVTLDAVLSRCTATSVLRFADLTPGGYVYTIRPPAGYAVDQSSGAVLLGTSSATVSRRFVPQTYLVAFVEDGLASHTRWKLTVDGLTIAGKTPVLTAELPNGTYAYAAAPIPGYTGAWSGTVVVQGTPVAVDGTFVTVHYAVNFTEHGLPNGTAWSVKVNGTTYSSTNSSLVVSLRNGTYAFKVGAVPDYTRSPASSTVRVRGASAAVTITFRPKGV